MRLPTRLHAVLATVLLAACADGVGLNGPSGVPVLFSVQAPAAVSAAETDALSSAFDLVDAYRVLVEEAATAQLITSETVPVSGGVDQHRLEIGLDESTVGTEVLVTVVGLDGALELYRAAAVTTVQAVGDNATPLVLPVRYTGPGIRGVVADDGGTGVGGVSVGLFQDASLLRSVATEPDGTYLFLGVAAGSYTVQPTAPPSSFLCPAGRDLTVQASDALIADFTASAAPCQIDVLVLSGGDVDETQPVADLFANIPGVTTETFFFVNQTPGLSMLRKYDVVLLFTNGIFDETTAIGNQLKQYVDIGGNLVIGSFYWQGRSDSEFPTPGWGGLETIDPFSTDIAGLSQGGATYEANDLGTVAFPNHPLIQGVFELTSIAGYSAGVLAKPSTTVVASWVDGAPLVGYRVLGAGQRIVAASLYPAANNPDEVSGDVQLFWANAVTWAGDAGGPIP